MAKRSRSNSKKKKSDTDSLPVERNEQEEQRAEDVAEDGDDDEPEIWDIVHAYTATQRQDPKNRKMCMADDCKNVAVAAWANNREPENHWEACEDCQLREFNGWPEDFELPDGFHEESEDEHGEEQHEGNVQAGATEEVSESPNSDGEENANVDEDDVSQSDASGSWVIEKVFSVAELISSNPTICSSEGCDLLACSKWVCQASQSVWYSCVDCQELDYLGWPPGDEAPAMSEEQIYMIATKCSRQDSPAMPQPRDDDDASPAKTTQSHKKSAKRAQITPLPNCGSTSAPHQAKAAKSTNAGVTPSPVPPTNVSKKPSAAALAMHKKWQEAAESMGGKDARIVLSKPSAKKLIYDVLYEAFAPMNITDIFKKLKAVVPSPILKACLDEMVFDATPLGFADSDDDEGTKKPSDATSDPSDPYAATVLFKDGRNANCSLYYLDQSKLENNGNGLVPEDRSRLVMDLDQATAEEEELSNRVQTMLNEALRLSNEPTNEEVDAKLLAEEEAVKDLEEQLEHFRKLRVNEQARKKTLKKIEYFASQWRSRKRICMDFLINMEECTDGAISAKKCLAGDGQIDIDSDEVIMKSAIEYAKKKRSRGAMKPSKRAKVVGNECSDGVAADENFVAVCLESSGDVRRIRLDELEG